MTQVPSPATHWFCRSSTTEALSPAQRCGSSIPCCRKPSFPLGNSSFFPSKAFLSFRVWSTASLTVHSWAILRGLYGGGRAAVPLPTALGRHG